MTERCTFCRLDVVDLVADVHLRGIRHSMHVECLPSWSRGQLAAGLVGERERICIELRGVANPDDQITRPIHLS